MGRVYFGLSSSEGDRLGHLVRGIQMLRSYGREADLDAYSDVVDVALPGGQPSLLLCVVGGESEATPEALAEICRETEWALGERPATLSVAVLPQGGPLPGQPAGPFGPSGSFGFYEAIGSGRLEAGMTRALPAEDFRQLCDWGQQVIGQDGGAIGEWPSATGP